MIRDKLEQCVACFMGQDRSPLAYLSLLYSTVFAVSAGISWKLEAVKSIPLFNVGGVLSGHIWGIVMLLFCIGSWLGVFGKSDALIRVFVTGLFLCWVYAVGGYIFSGLYIHALLAVIAGLCHAVIVISKHIR